MIAPILITGGSQRLGLAIAQFLNSDEFEPRRTTSKLQEPSGESKTRVIITYRSKKPEVDALMSKGVVAIKADFASDQGVQAFISALKELTSVLGGIIHNASDLV
jgi:dihydromonapterin reductase/dihydrofolate reductase